MKRNLVALSLISLFAFSCGTAELEAEITELKSKVGQLEKDLKAAKYEAEEQKKTAAFNKEEAATARARAEEILKDCKK